MISSKRQGYAGLLLEMFVVFLGVLVALAADSWRQNHEDGLREASYLASITADMDEATRILESAITNNAGHMARADTVLSILRDGMELPAGRTTLRSMMPMLLDFEGLPTGTLRAVLTTGELRLLQSEELRSLLIREFTIIEARVTWIDEVASQAGPIVQEVIHTLARIDSNPSLAGEPATLAVLRGEPELIAAYQIYINQVANVLDSQRRAAESVGRIRAAVSLTR